MRSFGKGLRLLAALVLMLLMPQVAAAIAMWLSPPLAWMDPQNIFLWLSIHHIAQLILVPVIMLLWSTDSLSRWGFNLNNAAVSLRWFGWFALFCFLGTLVFGILPMVFTHRLPEPGFDLNARNVTGRLGFYYLISGSGEEPLFRGLILGILLKSWTGEMKVGKVVMPVAGLWTTLFFMLAHVNYAFSPFRITWFSWQQQVFCLAYGLFYAAAFYRTGSLLCPILAHGVSNGIPYTLIYITLALTNPPDAPIGSAGVVTLVPNPPIAGQSVTVTYVAGNRVLENAPKVKLRHGVDGWRHTTGTAMTSAGTNRWTVTVALPAESRRFDFVFTDGKRWDNNGRRNWHVSVLPAEANRDKKPPANADSPELFRNSK